MKEKTDNSIRLRCPPSPTGPMTLGNARTLLYNFLFARQHGGKFILRIEDTDFERSRKEFELIIVEALRWLGIDWDEGPQDLIGTDGVYGPYRQSERTDIYKKYLQELLEQGKAYYCYCSKEELEAQNQAMLAQGFSARYSGHCRSLVSPPPGKTTQEATIRLKVAETKIEFKDLVRGSVTFDGALIGDFVIARNLDSALYHFAVVVDDELMKISHVFRGEEHLSNTPKHILLQKAFGFQTPVYAHLPLLLGPDKKKLSKRTAETSMLEYRDKGYLPEAVINFLALLGWHPKDNQEVFTMDELFAIFDIRRVQKAGAVFDLEKFDWMNGQHIRQLSLDELILRLKPFMERAGVHSDEVFLRKVVTVERERLKTLQDFLRFADFFFKLSEYQVNLLIWQKDSLDKTRRALEGVKAVLQQIEGENILKQNLLSRLESLIQEEGRGSVLWPFRVALSGKSASPDPLEIAEVLGKKESLNRTENALEKLKHVIL